MSKRTVLPLRIRRRLISTLMSNYQDSNQERSFSLKSNADFASRSTGVFGELSVLEQNHETWMSQNETVETFEETTDKDLVDSDVFKKPTVAIKRRKRCAALSLDRKPKWTKYSLEDIPLSSDATNTAVAMQFLSDLRKKREEKCEDAETAGKIVFKKPKMRMKTKVECSAVHFGSNPKANFKNTTSEHSCPSGEKKSSSDTICLGHLLQDDNE
ncbi:uncharacterized protein LOC129231594 [Uloborus diversus]|uniref:uncharacterized protein LOC129231594 n=1 Tax=Uloborus diversus TaxID=327109 RepID=UPI00240A11DC|nr:uncharacterized protein LOC129231594 [Uloborus diversus]